MIYHCIAIVHKNIIVALLIHQCHLDIKYNEQLAGVGWYTSIIIGFWNYFESLKNGTTAYLTANTHARSIHTSECRVYEAMRDLDTTLYSYLVAEYLWRMWKVSG